MQLQTIRSHLAGRLTVSGNNKLPLKTEFEFTLPKGYIDAEGNLHCEGTMRFATAMDEIAPLRDARVKTN